MDIHLRGISLVTNYSLKILTLHSVYTVHVNYSSNILLFPKYYLLFCCLISKNSY